MHGRVYNLAAVALCLGVVPGCADTANKVGTFVTKPFQPKTAADMVHFKTPDDRTKELHELVKNAAKKTPDEQERVSQELAAEIRSENNPLMRRHILRAITAYPTSLSMSVLVAGAKDSDTEVRRVACECLGKRGGAEAVQELTRVLNSDTEADVRLAAVRGLGQTHDSAAMATLAEALADDNPAMRFCAQQSLKSISRRDFGDDVEAWREYAKTGKDDRTQSIAQRLREL